MIDATGKIVCPGFVDPHSHSDFSLLANPTAESTIRQGVTTEVVGNCGWSYAPVSDHSREYMSGRLHTFGYDGPVIPWTTFGEHLDFLSDVGHSPNLAWFVGHNSIRLAAGVSGSHPTELQAALMDRLMREAMEAGALGMSTGLEFNPGREATTAELVRLNAIAGEYDGIYTSHVRNRDSGHPARDRGVPRGRPRRRDPRRDLPPQRAAQHGRARPRLGARRRDDGGRARGRHGRARRHDAVPRRARPALRHPAALGRRRRQGGRARPPARSRRRGSACAPSATATGASSTRASGIACACRRASSIRTGTASRSPQIADLRKADPWDCYFDVLADAGDAYESVLVVGRLFTDEHMAEMISHPLFCLGVDTFTVTEEGPLADVLRHPLGYSGHVHYLTHHVRENGTLRLEEAIRKMTSMPAAHFGLWDRGLLRAGYAADVVVFDYDGLDEVSTVDDPHHYARGVEHVLVNGTVVVDDGEHTGARPGRHLLRR